MKEYNREKKIWEEPQEKTGSLKKPKLCRGGKPHRFQLTLPTHMTKGHESVTPEGIEEYYKAEQRIIDFILLESKGLEKFDIYKVWYHGRFFNQTRVNKYYKCEICGKQESGY